MMKKVVRMARLFDSYGELLTERQREFMRLYYEEDLSLGEIATEFNISRQAVYDIVRRAESLLEEWEEKLGLVELRTRWQRDLKRIYGLLDQLEEMVPDRAGVALIVAIKDLLSQLQEN